MSQDDILKKIREHIERRVEHSLVTTEDAWVHEVDKLLPLYLLFQILDKLSSIESKLTNIESDISTMSGDSWDDHHNR